MKSMTFAVINDELFEQENETAQKYITCPVREKKKTQHISLHISYSMKSIQGT